jgi:S1-C subfamily serine protease
MIIFQSITIVYNHDRDGMKNLVLLGALMILASCAATQKIATVDFRYTSLNYLPPSDSIIQLNEKPKTVMVSLSNYLRQTGATSVIREKYEFEFSVNENNEKCFLADRDLMIAEQAAYRTNSFSQYTKIDRLGIFEKHEVPIDCMKVTFNPTEQAIDFVMGEYPRQNGFKSRVGFYIQENSSGGSDVLIVTIPVANNGVIASSGNNIGHDSWYMTRGEEEYIKTQEVITDINDGALNLNAKPQVLGKGGPRDSSREPVLKSSGTGFYVTAQGHIVTNYHVIQECVRVRYKENNLTIVAIDKVNDLALLELPDTTTEHVILAKDRPVLGEGVKVYGYPLAMILGTDITVTRGNISSLSGISGDYSRFTISAPIQPGNSGGPIVNDKNEVIGVVVSTLDNIKLSKDMRIQSQNVNFGIRIDSLRNMMLANEIVEPASLLSDEIIYEKTTIYLKCYE